jgi:ferredoxin-NADP reductase
MAPLWTTSFNGAIQVMGATQWKRLHRLAYVAAGLACFHFYLQTKADKRMPDLYIAILATLLLWRVAVAVLRRWRVSAGIKSAEIQGAKTKARFWRGDLKVIAMSNETPQVRTFRLAPVAGGPIPFVFQAGQFLSLSLEIDGKRVSRSYTIASPPTRDDYIELTIKREENGKVSRFLHDTLMTGQGIYISAPGGRFTFDPKSSDSLLLIAGGVGITPVMSILRDLTDQRWPGKIDLLFSVRSAAEIIFRNELENLTGQHPNLRAHVTVTGDVPADWSGLRGRVTADLLRKHIPDAANRPIYVCGPDAMAAAVRDELRAIGTPAERINLESFTPSTAVATENGSSPDAEAMNTYPSVIDILPVGALRFSSPQSNNPGSG